MNTGTFYMILSIIALIASVFFMHLDGENEIAPYALIIMSMIFSSTSIIIKTIEDKKGDNQ